MAAAARFINGHTPCDPVSPKPEDGGPSSGPDTKFGPAYSGTETGYRGRRSIATMVLIADPKPFQSKCPVPGSGQDAAWRILCRRPGTHPAGRLAPPRRTSHLAGPPIEHSGSPPA